MHDLSLTWDYFENVKWWMWIVVKCNGILESDGYGKCIFYIVLIWEGSLCESITLYLPIPLVPVMYPWVWVVTHFSFLLCISLCLFPFSLQSFSSRSPTHLLFLPCPLLLLHAEPSVTIIGVASSPPSPFFISSYENEHTNDSENSASADDDEVKFYSAFPLCNNLITYKSIPTSIFLYIPAIFMLLQ